MPEQPVALDVRWCDRCGEHICDECVNSAAGLSVEEALAWVPHDPPHLCPDCSELSRLEAELDEQAVKEEWHA